MAVITHILLFVFAAVVMWFFAGLLIDSINRVAVCFKRSGFAVAFLTLGLLTSISEIAVAVNSTIDKVPQVSAGDLLGASVVILFLITPVLAILGKGIDIDSLVSKRGLVAILFVIAMPALFAIDGVFEFQEGIIMLLLYIVLLYFVQRHESDVKAIHKVEKKMMCDRSFSWIVGLKMLVGGVCILLAGNVLVHESVFFADMFHVPEVYIGILLLSLGTNIPETTIAIRSVMKKHKDIAFGDYLGSAAVNTLICGVLAIVNGRIILETGNLLFNFLLLLVGLVVFYRFSISKKTISQSEGYILLSFYMLFLLMQIMRVSMA